MLKNNMYLSVIIPVYNEEKNLRLLYEKLAAVCAGFNKNHEMIFVDDGSRDNSFEELKKIAVKDKNAKIIRFKKNFGQTAALAAGIQNAKGEIIVPIDSDLENDPADIFKLIEKFNEGYDIVSGNRVNRWENNKLSRRIPSRVANWLISRATRTKLHDHGCTLKAYKREVFDGVIMSGDMHRMIAGHLSSSLGIKIAEVPVSYTPRINGKSNYGISRAFKVLLDIFSFYFFNKYLSRPMHFFGIFGFISIAFGFVSFIAMLYFKFIKGISFILTPLPILTSILIVVGIQFILMGLLAEIFTRAYQKSGDIKTYAIKEKINFDD